jgi:hypothetical protein
VQFFKIISQADARLLTIYFFYGGPSTGVWRAVTGVALGMFLVTLGSSRPQFTIEPGTTRNTVLLSVDRK